MSSSRWQQIERLYHAALQLEENQRAAFLEDACGADSELRREIESLLRYVPGANGFIGKPAVEIAAADIARDRAPSLIGREIGSFRILARIGSGGMGEVWKARDIKLGREVAVKSLPEEFARDKERLARFGSEAKLLASVNHPNIAAIYGVEDHAGTRFLILELVEGETLAQRLKRGPIGVPESLGIAVQIAEALEAAHREGVVHRDLKPANIKLTAEGKVKVLDFGLAKLLQRDRDGNSKSSAFTESVQTEPGVILGTAAYMSPEQAKGATLTRATDIWAFGCVLYEMLAGRKAFGGPDSSEVIASILRGEPDWRQLPAGLNPRLREVLERCLDKGTRNRWHDIADVRVELERLPADPIDSRIDTSGSRVRGMPLRFAVWWALATTLLVATAVGIVLWTQPPTASPGDGLRFTINPPPNQRWGSFNGMGVSLSPDGQYVAFLAGDDEVPRRLYLRPTNGFESRRVPDSDGAYHPFFSPDGRQLGFFASDRLWRVPSAGGRPIEVGRVDSTARGATWASDGYIYFGGSSGISRIAISEGSAERLTSVDRDGGEGGHRWPELLPGGKALLFTVFKGELESNRVALLSLETNQWRVLIQETGHHARYAPTGHIVYMRGNVMMAARFDLDRLDLKSPPEPVLAGIEVNDGGAAHFAFSENGVLVYVPGELPGTFDLRSSMVWMDREGNEEALTAPDGVYLNPVISHGGRRVAFDLFDEEGQSDIGIWDLERNALTRLVSHPAADAYALWTPDDVRIIFNSHRDGQVRTLFSRRADGVGSAERLLTEKPFQPPVAASSRGQIPSAISADGQTLLFAETNTSERAVYTLSMATGASRLLLRRAYWPKLSPDGKWVAYEIEESEGSEIYVSPFPEVDSGRWKVSTAGGLWPVWSRDGSELFYREATDLMAVSIDTEETFEAGIPRALFSAASFLGFSGFDVSPDGRFLMLKFVDSAAADTPERQIHVVTDWFEELRAQQPVP